MTRRAAQFGSNASHGASRTSSHADGFTLVEVLVSAGIFAIAMIAAIQIFGVSSDAAAKTAANTEVSEKSAAVRDALSDELTRMAPGLLVIECPPPTTIRRETHDGPAFMQIRQDRLVFLTKGDVDQYQSFTDPTRADPGVGLPIDQKAHTASSSEALVYFGPGIPLSVSTGSVRPLSLADDTDPNGASLTASDWVFQHRAILLMLEADADADPAWVPTTLSQVIAGGGMLDGGALRTEFLNGSMDAIVADSINGMTPSARTFASLILEKNLDASDLLSETPSIASLWQPSYAPRNATMTNYALLNYYTRSGSNFITHMADFRIEWTDGGRIDPLGPDGNPNTGDEDLRTRWFGLRPDPNATVTASDLNDIAAGNAPIIPTVAVRRRDFTSDTRDDEADVYGISAGSQSKIEWSKNGNAPGDDSAYRAIWRTDTWQYRPRALRFTYRIYDQGNRLTQSTEVDLNENGDMDPDDGTIYEDNIRGQISRSGRSFSIVVPLQ